MKARRAGKNNLGADSHEQSQSTTGHNSKGVESAESDGEPVEDAKSDDFIVDDDSNEDNTNWRDEMPLELTNYAQQSAKEYFKIVIDWMVHRKINPAFNRNDQVYIIAFRKTDDEAKGYAGSKFMSSIWKPDFKRALEARPEFNDHAEDSDILPLGCEACGRSSHPAKWRVTFTGKAYHPQTLEPLKDDAENTDDENDGDVQSCDVHGQPLLAEEHVYQVGSHCKSNAFVAHSLLHWRWHLNEWVLQWLETQGHTTPEQIVKRDSWSTKRRRDLANKLTDEMEETHEIRSLWRDFRNHLEEARSSKVAAFGRVDEVRK